MGKLNAQGEITQRTAEKKLHSGREACKWGAFFSFLMTDGPHHRAKAAVLMSRLNKEQCHPRGYQRGQGVWTRGDGGGGGREEGWEERGTEKGEDAI